MLEPKLFAMTPGHFQHVCHVFGPWPARKYCAWLTCVVLLAAVRCESEWNETPTKKKNKWNYDLCWFAHFFVAFTKHSCGRTVVNNNEMCFGYWNDKRVFGGQVVSRHFTSHIRARAHHVRCMRNIHHHQFTISVLNSTLLATNKQR